VYKVLLLGASNMYFSESGEDATAPNLLRAYLRAAAPDSDLEVADARVAYGERMAEFALRARRREEPNAVVLLLGTNNFEQDYVVYAIRRRWPRLYPMALSIADRMNRLSGASMDGGADLRGELFRLPKRLGLMLVGGDPLFPTASAFEWAKDTLDALVAAGEDRPLAAVLHPTSHLKPPKMAAARVAAYSRMLEDYCRAKSITFMSRLDYCAAFGVTPRPAPAANYSDRATREADAKAVGDFVLRAAGIAGKAV
jgi:hypothetical protein